MRLLTWLTRRKPKEPTLAQRLLEVSLSQSTAGGGHGGSWSTPIGKKR